MLLEKMRGIATWIEVLGTIMARGHSHRLGTLPPSLGWVRIGVGEAAAWKGTRNSQVIPSSAVSHTSLPEPHAQAAPS